MQPDIHSYRIYTYPDIFSKYFSCAEGGCISACPDYTLIFVFSGELTVCSGNCEIIIRKGEYIFLRKDPDTILDRKSDKGEPFSSVFMGFSHNFLYEFYRNMKKNDLSGNIKSFPVNIIKLPCNPYLESIYISLLSYLQWNIRPMQQIVEIKLMEAVYSLLMTDKRFYTCLFDFAKTFDVDNNVFKMNDCIQNITYRQFPEFPDYNMNLSCRECKPVNNTNPVKCTRIRKLETAYIRAQKENNAACIYMEAGYRDITRGSRSCERLYSLIWPDSLYT